MFRLNHHRIESQHEEAERRQPAHPASIAPACLPIAVVLLTVNLDGEPVPHEQIETVEVGSWYSHLWTSFDADHREFGEQYELPRRNRTCHRPDG